MDIEGLAVAKILGEICKSDYLQSYLNRGDKEPSWDGNIYLFDNPNGQVRGNEHKIPVQIKGTIKNLENKKGEIKYHVKKIHLQNYKRAHGVLFFVVKIDEEKRQAAKIYYAELSPLKIHHILQTKNKSGKNIGLFEFPHDIKHMEQLFVNFSQARQIQANFDNNHIRINNTITDECKNITLYPTGDLMDVKNPLELIGKEFYATIKRDDGSLGILDTTVILHNQHLKINTDINFHNVVYYEEFILERGKNWVKISIGDFFFIEFKNIEFDNDDDQQTIESKIHFDLNRIKQFDKTIHAIRFLKCVFENYGFNIGENFYPLNMVEAQVKAIIPNINDDLIQYSKIEILFKKLGIPLNIELNKLSDQDNKTINKLIPLILDEVAATFTEELPVIFINNIEDYKFILQSEKTDGNKQKIFIFPTQEIKRAISVTYDSKDKVFPIPCYRLINPEILAEITNLDYDDIYREYIGISEEKNPCKNTEINRLYLGALKSYDKGGINKEKTIKLAQMLIEWEIENVGEEPNNIINLYQVYKRMRELTKSEKDKLLRIAESENDIYKTAIYLILGSQEQAEYYFEKLNDSNKELFISWPIYHFWNKN